MDKLPDKQRTYISRMSTARIIIKLTKLCSSEETLSSLERAELLQMDAELLATGIDQVPTTTGQTVGYDSEIEKL